MRLTNDYQKAVDVDGDLFAVEMSDGGWSVADGPGTRLSQPDELELAGWHLPVRFESEAAATAAIRSGPHEMFDITQDCAWARHCVAAGGTLCEAYRRPGRKAGRGKS